MTRGRLLEKRKSKLLKEFSLGFIDKPTMRIQMAEVISAIKLNNKIKVKRDLCA